MDVHKNAPLTPKGREAMVRSVIEGGLRKAAAARDQMGLHGHLRFSSEKGSAEIAPEPTGACHLARQNISSGYAFEDAYGYSRAVRVGNHVFVSGTTARPPHLDGDAYLQARAALTLIAGALAEAGADMRHVVRTVVYVVDMADTERVARAHFEAFDAVRPASTLVQVGALTPASARVEIEVTAIISD